MRTQKCIHRNELRPKQIRVAKCPEKQRELNESVAAHGVLIPLIVKPLAVGYEIIEGHRRHAAGVEWYECIVVEEGTSDAEIRELQLTLDLQKESFSPFEVSFGCNDWMKLNPDKTAKDLAAKLGKDASWVSKMLALWKCPEGVIDAARAGRIGLSDWVSMSKAEGNAVFELLTASLNGATRSDLEQQTRRAARNGFSESTCKRASIACAGGTVTISADELDMVVGLDILEKLIKSWRRDVGKKDLKQFVSDQKKKLAEVAP